VIALLGVLVEREHRIVDDGIVVGLDFLVALEDVAFLLGVVLRRLLLDDVGGDDHLVDHRCGHRGGQERDHQEEHSVGSRGDHPPGQRADAALELGGPIGPAERGLALSRRLFDRQLLLDFLDRGTKVGGGGHG